MPRYELNNFWIFNKTKTILKIVSREYVLSVFFDAGFVPSEKTLREKWRMRTDGHIVNSKNQRLVWRVVEENTGFTPKRVEYKDGNASNLCLRNLVYLSVPSSPQGE